MKIAAIVTLLLLLLASASFGADVNGKWKATFESPNGPMELTFNLKAEGSKVTGTSVTPMGELPISDGSIEGDKISFTVANDQFKVVHKGTVSGDEMKLKVEIGDQTFDMTAKRSAS